jgi:Uma2 family endonuclease
MRMGDGVVFEPDARLELIEGELYEKAPNHAPHAGRANMLLNWLCLRCGDSAIVSPQHPVILSELSVPEPDVALLKPRADYYSRAHPKASDVLLAVEVSDNTLAFDLHTKIPLYARCRIAEAWVVNVNERVVHVFREPGTQGYGKSFIAKVGDDVVCEAVPKAVIQVAELFQG